MSYQIEFVRSAVKEFRNHENLYRIRIGNYRIIYAIENDHIILIIRVRHRKDVYDNL